MEKHNTVAENSMGSIRVAHGCALPLAFPVLSIVARRPK